MNVYETRTFVKKNTFSYPLSFFHIGEPQNVSIHIADK